MISKISHPELGKACVKEAPGRKGSPCLSQLRHRLSLVYGVGDLNNNQWSTRDLAIIIHTLCQF